jgi:hypothetical protein
MNNYNFSKKIYIKKDNKFCLEIYLNKDIFNNFNYKIFGSLGYYEYGSYSSYKNNNNDNIITFTIDIIQTLFISIKQNNIEYFSFINENSFSNSINYDKNININIKKISEYINKENFNNIDYINDYLINVDNISDTDSSNTSIIDDENDLLDNNIKNIEIKNNSDNSVIENIYSIDNIDNI